MIGIWERAGKVAQIELVNRKGWWGWLLWEVHTEACTCSYCHQWRGQKCKLHWGRLFSRIRRWRVFTFRTSIYQHYIRLHT